jgi:signal transduction histidine kinase
MTMGEQHKLTCVTVFGPSSPTRLRHEIENAARAAGFDLDDHTLSTNVDLDRPHPQVELVGAIAASDCLVIDLSYLPQSFYYHIGMAHAAGKRIVLLVESGKQLDLPPIIKSLNVLTYRTDPNRFNIQPARIRAAFQLPIHAPVFGASPLIDVDWDRLEAREAENLCLELLTQLGYRKVDWSKEAREIDIVAELPKKDPDGYEYKELWLVSISPNSKEIPLEILFDDPEYFMRRVLRPSVREDFALAYSGMTFLVVSLNDDDEVRRYFERYSTADHRRYRSPHGSDYVRTRIWDRTYLTSMVRQFPSLAYKYFSDEAQSAKYRKSREELNDENLRLANGLARTIAELEEERNRRASAERDAAWKDISFAAAHKIGNPVSAIDIVLDSLRMRIRDAKSQEALSIVDNIEASVDKAQGIVDQFKSLTRAQDIEIRPFKLLPLLIALRDSVATSGVSCTVTCDPDIEVCGDIDRLTECFDELVANSMLWFDKPTRGITIAVISDPGNPPDTRHSYVLIDYQDNGPGIKVENKGRIFNAFFTTRDQGTGLGLALVIRMIEGQDGYIREIGRPGKGAEFEIYLPIATEKIEPTLPGLIE